MEILKPILDSGYKIVIATKNVYAKNLLNSEENAIEKRHKDKLTLTVLKKDKKEKFRNMIKEYNGKVCIIGNNLSDDILNSYRIGAPYIYIGKSKVISFILRAINYISFKLGIKSMYNRGIQLKNIMNIREIFNLEKRKKVKRSVITSFFFMPIKNSTLF